jgi:hypothetical protein
MRPGKEIDKSLMKTFGVSPADWSPVLRSTSGAVTGDMRVYYYEKQQQKK